MLSNRAGTNPVDFALQREKIAAEPLPAHGARISLRRTQTRLKTLVPGARIGDPPSHMALYACFKRCKLAESIRELHSPPFPPLTWNGYFWEGRLILDAWRGFQSRRGRYASKDSDDPSDGDVCIDLKLPGD